MTQDKTPTDVELIAELEAAGVAFMAFRGGLGGTKDVWTTSGSQDAKKIADGVRAAIAKWGSPARKRITELESQLAARAPADSVTAPAGGDSRVPEAWTNLLAYVLQDDLHNRLTPRVIDIAYTAFMQAKRPNDEDGGASDWFNDTRPIVRELIAKLRKDLIEELVTPLAQAADSVLEDAARLDWLALAGPTSICVVVDRRHDGEVEVATDDVTGYGKTLREALDASRKQGGA